MQNVQTYWGSRWHIEDLKGLFHISHSRVVQTKPLTSISSLKAMSSLTRPSSLALDARFENQVKGIQYLLKSECSDSKSFSSCVVINPAQRLDSLLNGLSAGGSRLS